MSTNDTSGNRRDRDWLLWLAKAVIFAHGLLGLVSVLGHALLGWW